MDALPDEVLKMSVTEANFHRTDRPADQVSPTTPHIFGLDLLRGLAALAVCAGHLRGFQFVDYGRLTDASAWDRMFYFATGLGHQAVVVFFVLSGYLVGGSVLTAFKRKSWSWTAYALRRLCRLWTVLLPALALTWLVDTLGARSCPEGYRGAFMHLFQSGPSPARPADWSLPTLLGNVAFLQTIFTPVFGSNGPLWSLANEFWYYVLFPLSLSSVLATSLTRRLVSLVIFAALCLVLPKGLIFAGLSWVFGAVAFIFRSSVGRWPIRLRALWTVCTGLMLAGALAASKDGHPAGSDFSIGFCTALVVLGFGASSKPPGGMLAVFTGLSHISFTLYVAHFPLMAFYYMVIKRGTQAAAVTSAYAEYFSILLLIIGLASVLWVLFERNTDKIRTWIGLAVSRRLAAASA